MKKKSNSKRGEWMKEVEKTIDDLCKLIQKKNRKLQRKL